MFYVLSLDGTDIQLNSLYSVGNIPIASTPTPLYLLNELLMPSSHYIRWFTSKFLLVYRIAHQLILTVQLGF